MTAAAAMQRETIRLAAIVEAVLGLRRLGLRRAARDEGGQAGIDIAGRGLRRTRLRLLAEFLRLLSLALLARLIGRVLARNERLRIRRNVGLRLARAERLIAGEGLVVAVLEILLRARLELLVVAAATAFGARLEVRVLLAELFVCHRDQPELMFSVLEVILRRDRIAGRLGITGKLEVFLRHVIGRAADLHIGAVGFINPCQRVMIAAVVIVVVIVVVVAPAHALVVIVMLMLTVSHGLLFNNS